MDGRAYDLGQAMLKRSKQHEADLVRQGHDIKSSAALLKLKELPPSPTSYRESDDMDFRWVEEMEGKWYDDEALAAYFRDERWFPDGFGVPEKWLAKLDDVRAKVEADRWRTQQAQQAQQQQQQYQQYQQQQGSSSTSSSRR